MVLEKSMGNPFVWKVVVLSWGKLDALLLDTWKISRCQNQNGCQTQTTTTHLLIKKRFCRLLLSYEIHWITCAVRHRMTDDQDQHKHTLSFLKSVLSFSKPQLSFQKIETPRILLSIAVNFGCSSYKKCTVDRDLTCTLYQSPGRKTGSIAVRQSGFGLRTWARTRSPFAVASAPERYQRSGLCFGGFWGTGQG